VVFEKNLPINCDGWRLDDSLVYEVKIDDIQQKYDLSINVRHRDIYEFMNLYVNIITRMPNNSIKKEIISLPLCDDGGKWYGNCSGDVCFQRMYLMKNVVFPIAGVYTFRINQEMRTEELRNLFDIGLRVEKSKKSN
jgi:gliding motility-associated lipoprotein GldH